MNKAMLWLHDPVGESRLEFSGRIENGIPDKATQCILFSYKVTLTSETNSLYSLLFTTFTFLFL